VTSTVRLVVFERPEDAFRAAADELVAAARAGGALALSGGSGPPQAFELAAAAEPDWSRARLYWGDDRAVAPDDEQSNYRLAKESLLDHLERVPTEIHRIEGELGAEEAARRYDALLEGVTIDLALQGIGPDGHTASLFPDGPELDVEDRRAVPSEATVEPIVPRVTMTIPMLNASRRVLFLVVGASKAEAARRAFAAPPGPHAPASLVRSREGETLVLLDREAAARLDTT
jgi:6-phosphogluconolactonase